MIQVIAINYENERMTNITIEDLNINTYKWWWIDFANPTDEEIEKLGTVLHFHRLAIEDCIYGQQRPKLDYYDDYSLIVTHTLGPKDFDQFEINFFIGEHYIVTFHQQDLHEINQVWNNFLVLQDFEDWDVYRILYEVFDKVVDNFFPIIYKLEDEINAVEQQHSHRKFFHIELEKLFELRHQLLKLRHAIHPIRDLLYRILNSHHLDIEERREYFVDIYDHLLKLSEMVDSNRDITNDIRDNFISLNSYQQNKVIQILTVITSIFAPLTFIAGIYGMNFANMPELTWKYGYMIVLGIMFTISISMIIWFRKKGWFK